MDELSRRIREDQKRVYEGFLKEELKKIGLEDKLPCFQEVVLFLGVDTLKDIYQGKDLSPYVADISQDISDFVQDDYAMDFEGAILMETYLTHMGFLEMLKAKFQRPKDFYGFDFFHGAEVLADVLPVLGNDQSARDYLEMRVLETKKEFAFFRENGERVNAVFRDTTERFLKEYKVDYARLKDDFEEELRLVQLLAKLGEEN